MKKPKYLEPITWGCKQCKAVRTSDPLRRHRMDWCDCGDLGVDLEQDYMKIAGMIEFYEEIKNDNEN